MRIALNIVMPFLLVPISAGALELDQKFWNQMFLEQSAEAPKAKEISRAIPQRLLDQGIDQIGQVNVRRLLGDLEDTTFRENTSFVPTRVGSRRSAMYHPKSKTLVINTSARPVLGWALSNEVTDTKFHRERLEPVLLHENYGALGIDDRTYDKSLGATILAYPPENLSADRRLRLREHVHARLQKNGGTTTVGGGGDDNGLWIKLKALHRALAIDESFDVFGRILDMNIEMDASCHHHALSLVAGKNEIRFCQSSFWFDLRNEENQLIEIHRFVQSLAQGNSATARP